MNYTISKVPLLQLASGDRLSLQLYKFTGAKPGKKAYIQANLHGSEISGNAVINELIQFLIALEPRQLNGEIWLVPVCNPIGINQRSHHFSTGRYNPYDGKDWNRIFWDYEQQGEDIFSLNCHSSHTIIGKFSVRGMAGELGVQCPQVIQIKLVFDRCLFFFSKV